MDDRDTIHDPMHLATPVAEEPARRSKSSHARLAGLQAENAMLKAALEQQSKLYDDAKSRLEEEATRAALLRKTVTVAYREKHEIWASKSWRVTAPLRVISRRLNPLLLLCARVWGWVATPSLFIPRLRSIPKRLKSLFRSLDAPKRHVHHSEALSQDLVNATYGRLLAGRPPPAVVIPVYNAAGELDACLQSVLRHTSPRVPIIVIDDASPDPAVEEVLHRFRDIENVTILRNDSNLGFTRTANRGIEAAGQADVVLLNSDTIVTPLWLRNLEFAAYSDTRIATATPFSNNAGAFSAPKVDAENTIPNPPGIDGFGRLVSRASARLYPRVPTGHGFCLYVRRHAIREVGLLDATAFPKGYGEENDFCMRASLRGWSHVVDDKTYIFHVRSASFGEAKQNLLRQGRQVLGRRYPQYGEAVAMFHRDPTLRSARNNVAQAAVKAATRDVDTRPRVLFVISTQTGGTPQTNQDLVRALSDRYSAVLLRCDSRRIEVTDYSGVAPVSRTIGLKEATSAFPHTSSEYDDVIRALLLEYEIELVHIRHIAWHSLNLPAIAKQVGVQVIFSFHDFYTICPTVKLLDENAKFCGGQCTVSKGECAHELWPRGSLPPLKHRAIHKWQQMMRSMLAHCDAFVTTSNGSRDKVTRVYPELSGDCFHIIPHGRDLEMTNSRRQSREDDAKLRILVPGNISVAKGAKIIEGVLDIDAGRKLEFHVLGNTVLRQREGIRIHGAYQRAEFGSLVAAIAPDIGAVFSIWPETFCHTLTEAWAAGLPVMALNTGAVGERISEFGGGWLIDEFDPHVVYAALVAIAGDRSDIAQKSNQVLEWQRTRGATDTTHRMAAAYAEVYEAVLRRRQLIDIEAAT